MQSKKTKQRHSRLTGIQDLVQTIEDSHDWGQPSLSFDLLDSDQVHTYFHNLHQMLTRNNLVQHQRLQTLNDGIYILIKGQVSFSVTEWAPPSLPSESKSSLSLTKSSFYSKPSLKYANCIISDPLFVFESQQKNCTALEDTTLIKIKEEQAVSSKFYELFNRRNSLYQNQYLSCDHGAVLGRCLSSPIFFADLKVHSNFTYKTYAFRQIVRLSSDVIGVVAEGTARLRHPLSKQHQFDKNGVMLPHLDYEVTSTLTLMLVKVDETASIQIDTSHLQEGKQKQSELKRPCLQAWGLKKVSKDLKAHLGISSYGDKKKEKQRRERDLAKISKDSEQYSIISSYLSKQNLNYAIGYNTRHLTREKRDKRVGKPEFLFSHYQSKHPTMIQSAQNSANGSRQPTEIQSHPSKTAIIHKLKWPRQLWGRWQRGNKDSNIRREDDSCEQSFHRQAYCDSSSVK